MQSTENKPKTRPDIDGLIRGVYARISYPRDIELGRLNWDDMGGSEPSDERAEWEIAFGDVSDALAAERDRADRAEARLAEAWDEGVDATFYDPNSRGNISWGDNPYRSEATA